MTALHSERRPDWLAHAVYQQHESNSVQRPVGAVSQTAPAVMAAHHKKLVSASEREASSMPVLTLDDLEHVAAVVAIAAVYIQTT